MLTESRIKQAKSNFSRYIEESLIVKEKVSQNIIEIYKRNAIDSLKLARIILDSKGPNLWIVVISYYSMFYVANAALCSSGYRVRDKIAHKVTSDALIVVLRNKLKSRIIEDYDRIKDSVLADMKADALIVDFDRERKKRGMFQYNMDSITEHSKAMTSYKRAKEFYYECFKLFD